jgi:hypothetical protein
VEAGGARLWRWLSLIVRQGRLMICKEQAGPVRMGRPDIDMFEAAMMRQRRKKGFFVGFDFSYDSMTEISRFLKRGHISIVPLTVREILDETIAQKLV